MISRSSKDESGVITAKVNDASYFFLVENAEYIKSNRVNCGKYIRNDVLYSLEYCFNIVYYYSSLNCTYKGQPLVTSDGFPDYSGKDYTLGFVDNHYILPNSNVAVTLEFNDCEKCSLSTGYSSAAQFWILLAIIIVFVFLLICIFVGVKYLIRVILHKKSE